MTRTRLRFGAAFAAALAFLYVLQVASRPPARESVRIEVAFAPAPVERGETNVIWRVGRQGGAAHPTRSPYTKSFAYDGGSVTVYGTTRHPGTTLTHCSLFHNGAETPFMPKQLLTAGTVLCYWEGT